MCGKEFITNSADKVHCSASCTRLRKEFRRAPRRKVICNREDEMIIADKATMVTGGFGSDRMTDGMLLSNYHER